jgi:putative membrane protein
MKPMLVASALALALSLTACNKAEQTAETAVNTASEAVDDAGAIASNAMVDVRQAVSPTLAGPEFVNTAAKSDAYEIAAARLAITNGGSQAVKDFANDMIKAHSDSTARIKAAAAKAGITPDPTLTNDQNDELAELGKKKGAEFDEDYIDGQVEAHQTALAMMRDYAEKGDNADLKAAAGEIAPVVQKHLDHVKSMDK